MPSPTDDNLTPAPDKIAPEDAKPKKKFKLDDLDDVSEIIERKISPRSW